MDFELGQTYGGYQFLELLRKSQDAVEYRVENMIAQRQEVLKVLPPFVRDDQDAARSFLQEARILARLTHPHIIGFYTAQPIDGRMAMTTEWAGFVPLTARLVAGPLPWREALDAAGQLLSALSCLHAQNVVHLDITPDHILYGPNGAWKLANFGMARVVNGVPLNGSGAVTGSPRYISPEQVKGGALDYRSDLYSFAAVLFEMLAGRPPFDSKSQFELMLAHVSGFPEPPSRYNPSLPRALDDVVLKALAKDPGERHASAADFASDLTARTIGLNGRPYHARAVEAVTPVALAVVAADAGELLAESEDAVETTAVPSGELAVLDAEPIATQHEDLETVLAVAVEPVPATAPEYAEPVLAVALDEPAAQTVADTVATTAAENAEPVLAVALDEAHALTAAEPVAQTVVDPVATTAPEDTEPVLAAALDEPAAQTVTEPVAAAAPEVEPVLAVALNEPVAQTVVDPVATTAPEDTEPVFAVALDEPVCQTVAEPIVTITSEDVEPVLAVALDELAAQTVSELAAATAPADVEPVLVVVLDEPVVQTLAERVATTTPENAEPVLAVATDEAVAAITPEEAEPLLAVALDEPAALTAAEPIATITSEEAEPLLAAALDEPAVQTVAEPVATTTPENAEPVLAVALDEPAAQPVAEPAATTAPEDAEPVLAVAVHEPAAATTPEDPEPMVAVSVDEPAEPPSDPPASAAESVEQSLAVSADPPVLATDKPIATPPVATVAEPAPAYAKPVDAEELEAILASFANQAPVPVEPAPKMAPSPAPGPDPSLQADLWAAAAIVAQAAAVAPPPASEPVSIVAVPEPAPAVAVPVPAPPVQAPSPYSIPALLAASQEPADTTHWIMFGSSAAFLAIVLIAIFLGLR